MDAPGLLGRLPYTVRRKAKTLGPSPRHGGKGTLAVYRLRLRCEPTGENAGKRADGRGLLLVITRVCEARRRPGKGGALSGLVREVPRVACRRITPAAARHPIRG